MSGSPRRLPPGLVALTTGELASAGGGLHLIRGIAPWLRNLDRALQAGLPGVLMREPGLLDGDFHALLGELVLRARPAGAWVAVHDRAHLVPSSGADGVHLGFRSLPPAVVREVLGSGPGVGLSTHAGDAPSDASTCDWRTFGPVYPTPSKQGLLKPTGLGLLAEEAQRGAPVWALGGLTPARAPEVLATGVRGLFVRGALLGAQDPARATANFLRALEGASR